MMAWPRKRNYTVVLDITFSYYENTLLAKRPWLRARSSFPSVTMACNSIPLYRAAPHLFASGTRTSPSW